MRIVLCGYYAEGLDCKEICRRSREGSRQKCLSYISWNSFPMSVRNTKKTNTHHTNTPNILPKNMTWNYALFEVKYAPHLPSCAWIPTGCIRLAPATQLITEWQGLSLSQKQHIFEVRESHPHLTWREEAQKDIRVSCNLSWSQERVPECLKPIPVP